MNIIDEWKEEEQQHKDTQRSVFPMSQHKPRSVKQHGKQYGTYEKSPHRSRMTSKLMSTTFKYRNTSVATILQFMLENGQQPISVSQILRFSLEGMENMILENQPELAITSETEAIQLLERHGLSPGKDNPTNQKRINNNLILESALNRPLGSKEATSTNIVSPEQIAEAQAELRKRTEPQVQFDSALVSENNRGVPEGWPIADNAPSPPTDMSLTVLCVDGISKQVKTNRQEREEKMIVCTECGKPSNVLLDFETSEGMLFPSDTCPQCEGQTSHVILSGKMAREGFTRQDLDPCDPQELKRLTNEAMKGGETSND